MTWEIAFLLALLAGALALFVTEKVPVDQVALALVAALVIGGILTPQEAFRGFGSEVVVILASIFVLTGALVRTGSVEWLGEALLRRLGRREGLAVTMVMALSAGLSAFLPNTSTTGLLLPSTLTLARRGGLNPSRLLMPLAYASMLGGCCTLIGTSTNLAASGLMERLGLRPIGFYELAPVGLVMVVVGIVYMVAVGRHQIPARAGESLSEQYEIASYLSDVVVPAGSPLAGQSLEESGLARSGVGVLAVQRGRGPGLLPRPSTRLEPGDVLLVKASRRSLLELAAEARLEFEAAAGQDDEALTPEGSGLAEAVVMSGSTFAGRSLKEMDFRRRYGLAVLAVCRGGHTYPVAVGDLPLHSGDVLLLQGPKGRLRELQSRRDLWVVAEIPRLPLRRRRAAVALGALVAAVVAGSAGWLPLSVALVLAAVAVVVSRCLAEDEVYRLVEWRLLVLIGGMTAFGVAMEKTGAADFLARLIAASTPAGGPWLAVAAFVALTMLLTQPMSNAAAALVVLPVAVVTAGRLGIDPRSLAMIVTLAASLSFATPLEPACLLVYGPGKYRFRDFVLVGLPLSGLVFVVLLTLGPWLWPL